MLRCCESRLGFWGSEISKVFCHQYSVDDIQDNSRLRRGSPAAHSIFGVAQIINSANYVYFLAQHELLRLKQWPVALKIFNEELLNLHRGQGMELYWRDSLTVPTEEEYLHMISNKTGGLFRLALKLMQAVSKTNIDVLPLAEVLGLIFQIQDDYKNISSDQVNAPTMSTRCFVSLSSDVDISSSW